MTIGPSPTVRRRRLGVELRRLRESAGLTADDVADRMEWSRAKVWRVETARVALRVRDVADLCVLYGADEAAAVALDELAREAKVRGWWHAHGSAVVDWFEGFVGLETAASRQRIYHAELVPGLFQTAAYARAVIAAQHPDLPADEVERRVGLRVARQGLLDVDQPPMLRIVLNEAVLRRPVGGPVAMVEQLRHLAERAERPNTTVQVLPHDAGVHGSMDGSFVILGFSEPADPAVVYLEYATGSILLEKSTEVAMYALTFDQLSAKALDPERSISLITATAAAG